MNDETNESPLIDMHGRDLDSLLVPEIVPALETALDSFLATDNNSNNGFTNSIGPAPARYPRRDGDHIGGRCGSES